MIYYKLRNDLSEIIGKLCQYKGVKIIKEHLIPDHEQWILLIQKKLRV